MEIKSKIRAFVSVDKQIRMKYYITENAKNFNSDIYRAGAMEYRESIWTNNNTYFISMGAFVRNKV